MITRFRIESLLIHQEKETSTLNSLPCFLDLKQITKDTMKAIWNDIAKSVRFDFLIKELLFQNLEVE